MSQSWRSAVQHSITGGTALLSLALLGLAGCSVLHPRPRLLTPLATLQLSHMQLTMPKGSVLAPGKKSPLVVTFTDATGQTLSTVGHGHGTIPWSSLSVTATVVKVNSKGVVQMPSLPWQSDGKTGAVTVAVPGEPSLTAQIAVTPRYDLNYHAEYAGSSGMDGLDGTDGINGMDGTPGNIDLNNPSPGGNGSDGTNGSDGARGGDGGDGPPVLVTVAMSPGNRTLLEVSVSSPGSQKQWFLIDPNGGSLTVASNGGRGGAGGKGGRGGRGGAGGIGSPNGMDGSNGLDGQDGLSGFDGRSGQVTLFYDPAAAPYIHVIRIVSSQPSPIIQPRPTPPLW